MKTFTVDHPSNCPWLRSTCCCYSNGMYARVDIKCGPYVEKFPENCPMVDSPEPIDVTWRNHRKAQEVIDKFRGEPVKVDPPLKGTFDE